MVKIKVSSVSYANSIPFVYGLMNSKIKERIDLSLDIPSECADKLLQGSVDIGLVPIAETLKMKDPYIISDFCIGAVSPVKTVLLLSNSPVDQIKTIYLDYQSRTSIVLIKVLASKFWKINPEWKSTNIGFENEEMDHSSATVLIGDRTFRKRGDYPYVFDLAEEWIKFTSLPFVFAAWVSNKKLDASFITDFNKALSFGIENIEKSIVLCNGNVPKEVDLLDYWKNNISFPLDERKKQGMQLFLEYCREII
jgi:chorismate dehydratase